MTDLRGKDSEILAVLFEVTRRLNEGSDIEKALLVISEAAWKLSRADSASVLLLDENNEKLLCRASCGLLPHEIDAATFRTGEGLAGWAAQNACVLRLDDACRDSRFITLSGQERVIRGFCCVPLVGRDGVIGVMTVTSELKGAFDASDESLLSFLAASVTRDLENARLYRLAVTDPLTGIYNRQFLAERYPGEFERHQRYGKNLTVILMDVDHFKSVNDKYGHSAGDHVLRILAHRSLEVLREVDLVIRYGGEEFIVILPETDITGGLTAAERLRTRIGSEAIVYGEKVIELTVSLGVTELNSDDRAPEDIIKRADRALYKAKELGRNRVETC